MSSPVSPPPALPPPNVTNQQFRADFTEFTDPTTYPESALTYWLALAAAMTNSSRWGNLIVLGNELFAAHNLVIEALNNKTVAVGGLPGINKGVVSSESPGSVSVSYDTSAGIVEGAAHWNLTTFGTRFIYLARQMGMGPVQVGVGCGRIVGGQFISMGPGWPGPGGGSGPGWPFS